MVDILNRMVSLRKSMSKTTRKPTEIDQRHGNKKIWFASTVSMFQTRVLVPPQKKSSPGLFPDCSILDPKAANLASFHQKSVQGMGGFWGKPTKIQANGTLVTSWWFPTNPFEKNMNVKLDQFHK